MLFRWRFFLILGLAALAYSRQIVDPPELNPIEPPAPDDGVIPPEDPDVPEDQSIPEDPSIPGDPSEPEDPSTPEDPSEPEDPNTPEDPSLPEDPNTPEDPSLPDVDEPTTMQPDPVSTVNDAEINRMDQPIVTLQQGIVVGSVAHDGDYYEFHGIPYADSTSGSNRFKAPRAPPSFEDIFLANRFNIKCVRALGVGYEGVEDCLVADVFTPTINPARQLPVMVWVKGKEFDRVYEHELSFRNFMEEEVVIVSLNYRESILGFLCLGTEYAPGNAGLKDIVAGLRWVRENVRQFGGNPNDITLFGHGSGAAAVDLVTLSPMANGLVNKAIAQSGNALAPWAVSRDNLEYAVRVAEALGHVVTDVQQLSQIFERTSVAALMGVINELDLTDNALAFSPCIERQDLEDVEPFLVRTPYEILAAGDFPSIPFITGYVDNEGTIRAEEAIEDGWLERMEESFYDFLQADLRFANNNDRTAIASQIRSFYFDDEPIDFSTIEDYIAYHGETMVLVSSIRDVRLRAQSSNSPTFLYQFSYRGILGESFMGPLTVETAGHSEELAYLFSRSLEQVPDRDVTISQILVERWTNFARTGDPTSDISNELWQPYTSDSPYYLRVLAADEIASMNEATLEAVLREPHPEAVLFWDDIYTEHFRDAESNWDLTPRNETEIPEGGGEDEGSGDIEGSGDDGNGDENNVDEGGEAEVDIEDGEEVDEEGGDDDGGNSASTTVGYTFLIMGLFTLLDKFHVFQITS